MQGTLDISFSNLIRSDINPIGFSIMGLGVVFTGLVIICLFITFLPKFLKLIEIKEKGLIKESSVKSAKESAKGKELLLAIATALDLHRTYIHDHQKITWDKTDQDSVWGISGRVQNFSRRSPIPTRRL